MGTQPLVIVWSKALATSHYRPSTHLVLMRFTRTKRRRRWKTCWERNGLKRCSWGSVVQRNLNSLSWIITIPMKSLVCLSLPNKRTSTSYQFTQPPNYICLMWHASHWSALIAVLGQSGWQSRHSIIWTNGRGHRYSIKLEIRQVTPWVALGQLVYVHSSPGSTTSLIPGPVTDMFVKVDHMNAPYVPYINDICGSLKENTINDSTAFGSGQSLPMAGWNQEISNLF